MLCTFYELSWLEISCFVLFTLFFWLIFCFSKIKISKNKVPFFLVSYFESNGFLGIIEKQEKLLELKIMINFFYYSCEILIVVVFVSLLVNFFYCF